MTNEELTKEIGTPMTNEELTKEIVNAASEVYSILLDGHNEKVYERALAKEFRIRGVPYKTQVHIEVFYKNEFVGDSIIDLLVDGKVVVEAKASANISKGHESQNRAYMRTSGIEHGVVINFPTPFKNDVQCSFYEIE